MSRPISIAGASLPAGLPDLPAFFSPCLRCRYWLARDVGGERGPALFILHNPSTADANVDDPTIRRCLGYTRRWGCRTRDGHLRHPLYLSTDARPQRWHRAITRPARV